MFKRNPITKLIEAIKRRLQMDADFRWFLQRGFSRKAAWFNAQNTVKRS